MKRLWRSIRFLLIPLLCAVAVLILAKFVFFIGYVPSASMTPTISEKSWILGTRIFGELRVGDVVIFEHEGKTLVKRIAAVGGDTVYLNDETHTVSVNNPLGGATRVLTVPENQYFLLGDNTELSIDARYWEEPFIEHTQIRARFIG